MQYLNFVPGKCYKHVAFVDVFVIIKDVSITDRGYNILVNYVNRSASGRPYIIDTEPDLIKVDFSLMKNWDEVDL